MKCTHYVGEIWWKWILTFEGLCWNLMEFNQNRNFVEQTDVEFDTRLDMLSFFPWFIFIASRGELQLEN